MQLILDGDFWDRVYLGATTRQLLIALVVAVVTSALLLAIRWLLMRQLRRVALRTRTQADDFAVSVIGRTRVVFIIFVGLFAGARSLPLEPGAVRGLHIVGVLVLSLQVAAWGNAVIGAYVKRQIKRRMARDAASATTMTAIGYIIRFVFYIVLLVLALDNLGFEVRTLVTTLGIGGIAIALAVQKILGDLFGSLSIVLDKPFVIGDFITVGDMSGTVQHIGLKTTRLRSISGEQLVFSNSDLLEARIRNYQRLEERRVVLTFGVVYHTPRATLMQIPGMLAAAVERQPNVRLDRAHLNNYGASSIDFELVYFVGSAEYVMHMNTKQAVYLDVHAQFEAAGIEFAYPSTSVYLAPTAADSSRSD